MAFSIAIVLISALSVGLAGDPWPVSVDTDAKSDRTMPPGGWSPSLAGQRGRTGERRCQRRAALRGGWKFPWFNDP
jgi:hypothetical protein